MYKLPNSTRVSTQGDNLILVNDRTGNTYFLDKESVAIWRAVTDNNSVSLAELSFEGYDSDEILDFVKELKAEGLITEVAEDE